MTLLEVQVKEAVGPVPPPEEARLRRLVSRISICFDLGGPAAALLQESPLVAQMPLAVAMITRVAVGRRVLPALVDGGHLSFCVFGSGCAFWLFEPSSAARAKQLRLRVLGYQ